MRRVFTLTAVVAFTGACATQTLIGEEALDASETPDASNVPDVSHAPDAFPVEAPAARLLPELGDGGGAVVPTDDAIYAIGNTVGAMVGPQTLYSYHPKTKTLTAVGPLSGHCVSDVSGGFAVASMAIGASSNAYVVGGSECNDAGSTASLWKLDLATAAMTFVGTLLNDSTPMGFQIALSFVPKGTLDPGSEALVGYVFKDDGTQQYVKIDPATATGTLLNALALPPPGLIFSMTSVAGGGAFAMFSSVTPTTVLGIDCGACLLQVDPKTGAILQNYGAVIDNAFGVTYYAGDIYGFPIGNNQLVEVSWQLAQPVTSTVPLAEPSQILFSAAASGTNAPLSSPDGGVPPLK